MSNSKYKTSKKPVSNCGKVGGSTHGNRVFQGLEIKESSTDVDDDGVNDCTSNDDETESGVTSTTFSLQECMDEFRARRLRRMSTHRCITGRDTVDAIPASIDDAHLIDQNRTNKEQERKCKPCKDGFCYCFTSDSGEGGEGPATCAMFQQQHSKRINTSNQKLCQSGGVIQEKERTVKSICNNVGNSKCGMEVTRATDAVMAISRLEISDKDAPMIHIIQEWRDQCVYSEVRVNKYKIEGRAQRLAGNTPVTAQRARKKSCVSYKIKEDSDKRYFSSTDSCKENKKLSQGIPLDVHTPTAPTLEKIIGQENGVEYNANCINNGRHVSQSKLQPIGVKYRHLYGGRLLQKRLLTAALIRGERNLKSNKLTPPKTLKTGANIWRDASVSSTTSTSTSVREAEQVIDQFLLMHGYKVPQVEAVSNAFSSTFDHCLRKERGLFKSKSRDTLNTTAFGSSKLFNAKETVMESSDGVNAFAQSKNLHGLTEEKSTSKYSMGWSRCKEDNVLGYNNKISQKKNPEPSVPMAVNSGTSPLQYPCLAKELDEMYAANKALDMVDGAVKHNLAVNMANKHTPVKGRSFVPQINEQVKKKLVASPNVNQKFILSEQWRNFSNWANKSNANVNTSRISNFRVNSKSFLKSSKKKLLHIISSKKEDKERANNSLQERVHTRSVGIQTSLTSAITSYDNMESTNTIIANRKPSGSYHTPMDPLDLKQVHSSSAFHFDRTIEEQDNESTHQCNCPLSCAMISRKSNFLNRNLLEQGTKPKQLSSRTYRSFSTDIDQDVTISKLGYILSNIRSKLEASDEQAERTFQEVTRKEAACEANFDKIDHHYHHHKHLNDCLLSTTRHYQQSDRLLTFKEPAVHHSHHGERSIDEHPFHEPIYSEIEEDSIHIQESPNYDNRTGVQHFNVDQNPEVIYAVVNKPSHSQQNSEMGLHSSGTAAERILDNNEDIVDMGTTGNKCKNTAITAPEEIIGKNATVVNKKRLAPPPPLKSLSDSSTSRPTSFAVAETQPREASPSGDSMHKCDLFFHNPKESELSILPQNDTRSTGYYNETQMTPDLSNPMYTVDMFMQSGEETPSYKMLTAGKTPCSSSSSSEERNHQNEKESTNGENNLNWQRRRPSSINMPSQSTPKVTPKFLTKVTTHHKQSNESCSGYNILQLPRAHLFSATGAKSDFVGHDQVAPDEEYVVESNVLPKNCKRLSSSNGVSSAFLSCRKKLKRVLTKSFRRSQSFITTETRRLSGSWGFNSLNVTSFSNKGRSTNVMNTSAPSTYISQEPQFLQVQTESPLAASPRPRSLTRPRRRPPPPPVKNNKEDVAPPFSISEIDSESVSVYTDLSWHLADLFAVDELESVTDQLSKAVQICRQIPELETSPEMVEAERLLLYSNLKYSRERMFSPRILPMHTEMPKLFFYIDSIELNAHSKFVNDRFFNYFYTITFDCNNVVQSTKSVECINGKVQFLDCAIECQMHASSLTEEDCCNHPFTIRCNIFMLRLRKVSALGLEPTHRTLQLSSVETHAASLLSVSSTGGDIVSRFRPQASFELNAVDFKPYEFVPELSKKLNCLCLRSKRCFLVPRVVLTSAAKLKSDVRIQGRAEVHLSKSNYSGYLNVLEPNTQHCWNQRWCVLDGLTMQVWTDANTTFSPLFCIEICDTIRAETHVLRPAVPEQCARPRSFGLNSEHVDGNMVYFAANKLCDFYQWLEHINRVLEFIGKWLLLPKTTVALEERKDLVS